MGKVAIALLLCLLTACAPTHTIDLLRPVVRIQTEGSQGSGFVVAPGKVVTVNHVIDGQEKITVEFFRYDDHGLAVPDRTLPVTSIEADPALDIAILTVPNAPDTRLPRVASASELQALKVFDSVTGVSCPFSMTPQPTQGHVNSVSVKGIIVLSAPCHPGGSGGPVYVLIDNEWVIAGAIKGVFSYMGQIVPTVSAMAPISRELLDKIDGQRQGS